MKDFIEFRNSISNEVYSEWSKVASLQAQDAIKDMDNSIEAMLLQQRTYSFVITLQLLEAYHIWKNQ